MTEQIRVVLADDHAVVREGIRSFLDEVDDIDVVAEGVDGEMAKHLIKTHVPDVAVLDIRMPGASGIEVTRWIREQYLPTAVLILTAFDDDPLVVAAIQAGAYGYILKNADADDVAAAVRTVHRKQSALDPAIAQKLMAHMARTSQAGTPVDQLTDRELEVLHLTARGLTNRGIGHELGISDRTVQGHLANIYAKLQANSRTEAVTKAIQLGLIHTSEDV
ncbi:MAG: response regulator transcription factor [Anaerolineae bacterium]|nr:response regulator transcription factor [Anaerolineae bacterium]